LVRASLLGTLTPLLPCGWFYAFALTAAGTARASHGALVMTVFWLGTVPALLGMGWIMSRWGGWLRTRLPLLTGALLIVIGLLGVVTRVHLPSPEGQPGGALVVPRLEKAACH
ncbi:MAG TPA: sulfite exporter TauE/SafE family protein, partial [Polyangiaceae bacterium]|nr:sulfite exporter TauE/SafE family protein [Polyangiaceae bacterium]